MIMVTMIALVMSWHAVHSSNDIRSEILFYGYVTTVSNSLVNWHSLFYDTILKVQEKAKENPAGVVDLWICPRSTPSTICTIIPRITDASSGKVIRTAANCITRRWGSQKDVNLTA
jgi:hypothetical protein